MQKLRQRVQEQFTVLVPVDEVSAFVSSNLRPDCVLIISYCSTFKAISDEK
jgi:hypothetical protein